jgi:N-acetylneuraminic acid mutarotase
MTLAIDSPSSGGVTLTQVHARFFHVDFVTPANSTFGVGANHTPNAEIAVNGFVDAFTDAAGFTIIPQQGQSQRIQSLGDKIMTPMVYRFDGGTESLWTSNTVCTDAACTQPTGVRWYQFDVTGGTFPATPVQQQTWTNGNDGLYRFMPSIAVDQNGNAAIGYATSSSTAFPGIRYAGRLSSDPPGNLGQGEATMFTGAGSQTGTNGRWGDYSMTTIDPADNIYAMGGRMSDSAGSEFTHPLEYDPVANSWTTKSATYPDNHVNNMACGVLTDAGTPYIYCVGGSAVTIPDIADRVFRYNPVTDVISPVAAPWPAVMGMVLPGGFTVFNNKLYILGGFDTITNGGQAINQIWEFTPTTNVWVQKSTVLPVALGYIPTTTIGSFIYTGGGSDITAGVLTDTTNSFRYDPVADSITTIAPIPRMTGETRALTFCNQMYVMGGGRTAPNPSNEVDIYDPVSNTWSMGLPFVTARRNFPTATDGTTHIWLSGGYASDGVTVLDSMEIFSCPVSPCGSPSPTPTATAATSATPTATATATATATVTASATPTATATATAAPRHTPTPRPRPTPPPRP